ncbi:reverse gyrase [Candidatus Brocadia sinica JPN1]|uniref:Reverse gyrase n=1 Tax=Candidatus Brocadia sinica JPN1 TaxID=1197129 RepID=A0ABQ0JYW2_9BACT|nr:reverse gyrase [Candidatus Brocadia sinica JPN1]
MSVFGAKLAGFRPIYIGIQNPQYISGIFLENICGRCYPLSIDKDSFNDFKERKLS